MIMRSTCPWHIHNSPLAAQGARFGGGKGGGGGTTYQSQTTQIPPEVRARYDAVNARAEQVAQQPFVPYTGQFVAPINPLQEAAINQIGQATQGYQPYQQAATTALTGAAEAALPYYGQAGESIQQAQAAGAPYTGLATAAGLAGTQAVNPQALQIGRYMDPYIQSVVAPTMQGLYQQQQQQQSQLMGEQAMRGAFGGDRGAIAAANLARQQGLAAQQAQAGLLSGAYGQALQAAQQQQGVGLGAAQANRAALQQFAPQALAIGQQAFGQPMAAAQAQQQLGQGVLGYGQGVAQSLAGLGQQGTQTGLAAGQALLGAGTLGQQTQQQLNAALYNQFLQQQGYPFQVAQFLANIALGTGPLYGSTTSGTTTVPTPFFSDERVKEDITEIGRTHDGQKIIKFRYKGEPEGTKHIGLSAQDVERHHPEAVSETAEGIKAVDYDAATKHAERAYGGGLLPMTSEGGAVHPSMAGLGFAGGGDVDPNADAMQKMYPWRAIGAPGKQNAGWTPGLSVKPQQPLGAGTRLPTPQQQPTGLSQLTGAVKTGADLYSTGKDLYKGGKEAYDWIKDQVTQSDFPIGGGHDYAAGGRAGYAGGLKVDLPYDSKEQDTPLSDITEEQPDAKLQDTKLPGVAGPSGGGAQKDKTASTALNLAALGANFIPGVGPFVSAGLKGLSMFAADGGRIGYATDGRVDPDMMARAKKAIAGIESGGRYDILGPMVGGDRAHGKYQVMGRNIPSWTEEALGRRMTPAEFLRDPEAQERVFEHHFGKALQQHGNLADAASIWHSGRPLSVARAQGARDVNMSTEDYVRRVLGGLPTAEHVLERREPTQGLAPPEAKKVDHAGLMPRADNDDEALLDTSEFRDLELPDRFAAGGVAGRHGYPTGGAAPVSVIDPDAVDPNNPEQVRILKEQRERALGLVPPSATATPTPTPATPTGVAPSPQQITTTPLPQPPITAASQAPPRDFFDRAGDWYDRNQNWVLPLVSGVGKMLASPSPFLGVAVGQGLAEAAPTALSAAFKQKGIDISQQRANIEAAKAIQEQLGVAASQANAMLMQNPNADTSKADELVNQLSKKMYQLYGIDQPGGLKLAPIELTNPTFKPFHHTQNLEFLYKMMSRAVTDRERANYQAMINDVMGKMVAGNFLLGADGKTAINIDENLAKQLQAEAARLYSAAAAPSGGLSSEERTNIDQQLDRLKKTQDELRQRTSGMLTPEQNRIFADIQRTGEDPERAGLPPEAAQLIREIRSIEKQMAERRERLEAGRGTPPIRPGQETGKGRAFGGRTGYQYGGGPLDLSDPAAIQKELENPQITPERREFYQKQYEKVTPEQRTPAGTPYRVNPLVGTAPSTSPEPDLPPTPSGSVDPNTGLVITSAPALPYSTTGGFPRDPGLPKQPHVLTGADIYQADAQRRSAEQETAFLNQATGQQADVNLLSMLKFANALKIVEGGGLTTDKARVANILRGLGLDTAANVIQKETDSGAAYVAAKTALAEAIRQSRAAFANPTQAEFGRVASEATPSADIPPEASITLLKENLAQQLWQNALRDDWLKARDEGGARNFTSFMQRWREAHPPQLFRESADLLLGNIKGTELPSPSKLTEGVVYVVPQKLPPDYPLRAEFGAMGLRPGDLFTVSGIKKGRDPETGRLKFGWDTIQQVAPEKAYETHIQAPGLRRGRKP